MRKKLLSLALALVMCLGLATVAMAAEISNGICTYELSNDPIGTVEIPRVVEWSEDGTPVTSMRSVYVVPDNTTVKSKTVPNGRIITELYSLELLNPSDRDWLKAGEAFVVAPVDSYGFSGGYLVCSEDLEDSSDEPEPSSLDYVVGGDLGGLCVVAESVVKAAGLTIKPYTGGTTPSTPETPTVPATPVTPSTGFTDVAATDYFAAPVAWAIEKEITQGTGNNQFSPAQNCTNAQILTFLWRAYGQPEPTIGNPFTNTIPDVYTKAAIWAYEKGMVSGTAFDVDTPCTRAMAVTYMWQAAGSPMPFASVDSFTDVSADAPYALAVAWALEKNITTGTSATTFSPADICNRGQIVTFLHRNLA